MDKFVTIKTFTYASECAIIRALLESEDIECFLKDEFMAQVQPFYSNAIGGIKLQVKESDLERASEILKEAGYMEDEPVQSSNAFTKLDTATEKIPFLKNFGLDRRILMITALIMVFTLGIGYYVARPSTSEKLIKGNWCVDVVTYNDKDYTPNSVDSLRLLFTGYCKENLNFMENGNVTMPGFNSHEATAKWEMENGSLHITNADTFAYVYNGYYDVDFVSYGLVLKSENTAIYCR